MLLCLYNRISQAKLLKTDEADEVFNVAENKTNSIINIFFLKNYFELGYCNGTTGNIFLKISLKNFLNTLHGWSRKKEAFGQIQSVLGIAPLYNKKSLKISIQRSSTMTFVKSLCSKS